jgi:hypothetical protein
MGIQACYKFIWRFVDIGDGREGTYCLEGECGICERRGKSRKLEK